MSNSPYLDHNTNRLHQGNSRCVIAGLPVSYEQEDSPPEETINASITAYVLSGLDQEYEKDYSYKAAVHIPVSEDNTYGNKLLTINMIADDRMENYWTLRRYIQTIKSGGTNGFPITDAEDSKVYAFDNTYRNRLTYISHIDIISADDSKQKHQTVRFLRCFPTNISDINLHFMEPSPVTFNVSFVYSLEKTIREQPPRPNTKPKGVLD